MVLPVNNGNNESNFHNNSNLSIKPEDLKKKIDKGEDVFILDVRNKEEHDAWNLTYDRYPDSTLIPVDKIFSNESLKQIPKDKEIIAFCAHGYRSAVAAQTLSSLGYKVKSVQGGMQGWSNVYDIAKVDTGIDSIKIWQIRRVSKGCMSYLIASINEKKATIIDPSCGIDKAIQSLIDEHALVVNRVIDTHIHADHLSGLTKIAKKYDAEIVVSSLEKYNFENLHPQGEFDFRRINDEDRFDIGDGLYLEAIHTPGHTEGSLSFRLDIKNHNKVKENMVFLFTGDTVFVNGVGRPDLHDRLEEFAKMLYITYQNKIITLPDDTTVLPSHYNSFFHHQKPIYNLIKNIKEKLSSISNSEKDFMEFLVSNVPPQPLNYRRIVSINKNMNLCSMYELMELESGPNSCGISA